MAYRLPGGRVGLTFEEGPFAGLEIEVEPIASWSVYQYAVALVGAFFAAEPAAEPGALRAAFEQFVAEAQPTWEVLDHRGPVPATAVGMLRLPLPLALRMCELWTGTFAAIAAADEPVPSAVDEIYPPSPLRDQLNEILAHKRAEAEAA